MPKPVETFHGSHTATQAYRAQVPWVLAAIAWYVAVVVVSRLVLEWLPDDAARGAAVSIIGGQIIAMAGAIFLIFRGGRRWTRERSGRCARCDYPRRTTSTACSECGRERPTWSEAEWCRGTPADPG